MVIGEKVLSNARFGNDVGIWEGSIFYEVLYTMFEVKAIISFVARFLVVVTIFIEIPTGR